MNCCHGYRQYTHALSGDGVCHVQYFRILCLCTDGCQQEWRVCRELLAFCTGQHLSSFIGVFGTFVVNVIMTIMLFASAINVTQGYSVWCQLIDRVAECSVAGFITNLWGNLKGIKPDNYAVELGMVQFGLWTELLLWTVISILSVVKLAKYHQREHIFRSLNRERERLLGSYNQPDF
ncbi:uncharacterized protein LOC110981457 isoform X2 [Acanthaster planci]|uniref:Uncharacterized protein LOC110981457 isoform X2 n=1 Tax=Acanthaster planci TaxID=133434 RepID=A0A8B7YN93_ACAPL|nr:uncharacterized protein LOC110981457 isoform X2 [Acanthaster planci]XP_022094740.1 uncharacterized protein LOC110981457 isoform X2 [Acanthaster planci]